MSTTISAKVSEDLKKEVDEAREDGESRSAAVGRLVRDGLEEENYWMDLAREVGNGFLYAAFVILLFFLFTNLITSFEMLVTALGTVIINSVVVIADRYGI